MKYKENKVKTNVSFKARVLDEVGCRAASNWQELLLCGSEIL